jgi:hypothetical protein
MKMVLVSLFAGFVAAGFVWYGWALVENTQTLLHNVRARRESKVPAPEAKPENPAAKK